MRIAYYDDGLSWDCPNFRWGDPSYVLEPGDVGYVPPASILPNPTTKHRKHMITLDYIPQSYGNLKGWLEKQPTELTVAVATAIGMSTGERDGYLAAVASILTPVSEIVDLMEQLEEKTAGFPAILEAQLPIIRAQIKRAKTSPGCNATVQTQLDWVGDSVNNDPAHSRPSITVEAQRGRVKIAGKKPGFEAVNIYRRIKGEVQWKLIAIRKRKFPFYDESPLAVPTTPEVREYMAIGVVNDEEIGQMSEIKEVVYAG
jgi:hypothetical protein